MSELKSPGDPVTEGPPQCCDLRAAADSHSKWQRKIPLGFPKGTRRRHFKICHGTLFFLTRPAFRRNYSIP